MKRIILGTFIVLLMSFSAANATIYYDSITSPLFKPDFAYELAGGPYTQGFSVLAGEVWEFSQITLNIGQGSEADMFLRILNSDLLFVAQTQVTSIDVLFDFVETDFFFATPLTLATGSYLVESNYTVTGDDNGSYWSANLTDDFEMRIGDPAPIPEPSTLLLLGAGLLGLVGYGRKRSGK